MQANKDLRFFQPLITVIIPSYNHEKYIAQSIESVLSQSYKNIELIVIDDGSTDESLKIIKALEIKHGFTVISRKNVGLAKTLNEGIGVANGEYISFLASDDYYLPQRIENAVLHFNKSAKGVIAVYCDGYIVNDVGQKIGMFGEKYPRPLIGSIYSNLLIGNWIPALGMTYNINLLKEFMFDDRFKIEDHTLYLRIFKNKKYCLDFYNEFDFAYRWHGGNFSGAVDVMRNENALIQKNFIDLNKYVKFKSQFKMRKIIGSEIIGWNNYYLLGLEVIRMLQIKSKSYHRNVLDLFLFYLTHFGIKIKKKLLG